MGVMVTLSSKNKTKILLTLIYVPQPDDWTIFLILGLQLTHKVWADYAF